MTRSTFMMLAQQSALRYRPGGRFAQGFAHGKLTGDPVFAFLLENGLLNPPTMLIAETGSRPAGGLPLENGSQHQTGLEPGTAPERASRSGSRSGSQSAPDPEPVILDLGCGQGVVAALLEQAHRLHTLGQWPAHWPAPVRSRFHGIELMPRDVARAHAALGDAATFVNGDIAVTPYPKAHTVLILDVLHYLPFDAQERVLAAVRAALIPGGRLVMRVGDAEGGFRFHWSKWVDHVVTWCRGHRLPRLYCRGIRQWGAVLHRYGFDIEQRPMSEGTLFANVLLIGSVADSPAETNG